MGRRALTWRTPSISADALKNFACLMLLLSSIGVAIVENALIRVGDYTAESLDAALQTDYRLMNLAGLGSVLQLLGGLSVPIFAFLLVEGLRHTGDVGRYFRLLLLTAVLSEPFYDLAMAGSFGDWSSQNALLGTVISLAMLLCLRAAEGQKGPGKVLLQLLVVLGGVAWVTLIRAQYGLCMVLLTAVFYLFYERPVLKTLLGALVSLLYVTGPLAFYGIWCYNERRRDRIPKYAYYLFYPLHLGVLGLIAKYI